MKIAIIPARAGSKRIANKNIIDFCGKPMIAYALDAAGRANLFDKVHVSTDSEHIKTLVEDMGCVVDFMRPVHLADDQTGLIAVLQWVLEEYSSMGLEFQDVCCLMPSCPLIDPGDIVKGYEKYLFHEKQFPLHVVAPYPVPIEWAYRKSEEGFLTPVNAGMFACRSQDLPKAYFESGPFSIFHRSHLLRDNPVSDENFISIMLPPGKAVDIDDADGLRLAQQLYLGRKVAGNPELMQQLCSETE